MTAPPVSAFGKFVIGSANEVAWTAARTLASAAAPAFNPLFVRGAPGLGKTHLLRIIADDHQSSFPGETRVILPADELVVAYTAALRAGTGHEYELTLRGAALLLVDNIDDLRRWPNSQEMLARSVAAVLESGGRVAFTAARGSHDLEDFCPRLIALAAGGLLVDLNAPDLELRMAIVEEISAEYETELSADIVATLARNLMNVRLLRGAVSRLAAYSRAERRPINIDYTRDLLGDLFRAQRRFLSIDEIQTRVSEHFHLRKAEMTSARRSREVARPRQVAMYLSKQLTPRSLPEIGRRFGGRDHTTVIHAIRQIEKLRLNDMELDRDVRFLERDLLQ